MEVRSRRGGVVRLGRSNEGGGGEGCGLGPEVETEIGELELGGIG